MPRLQRDVKGNVASVAIPHWLSAFLDMKTKWWCDKDHYGVGKKPP